MSKFRRAMVVLGVGFTIILLMIVFGSTPPPGKIMPLGIRLVAFTNVSTQVRTVQCTVSNPNDRVIWIWPAKPQVRLNGEWPPEVILLPVPYTVLKPRRTTQLTITPPSNPDAEPWRVPLFWTLEPTKKEWVDEFIRQNVSAVQSGRTLPGTRFGWGLTETWTNYSPEITP